MTLRAEVARGHHFCAQKFKLWFLQWHTCISHAFPYFACMISLSTIEATDSFDPQHGEAPKLQELARNVLPEHVIWVYWSKDTPPYIMHPLMQQEWICFLQNKHEKPCGNSLSPRACSSLFLSLGRTAREWFCSNVLPRVRWSCNIYRCQSYKRSQQKIILMLSKAEIKKNSSCCAPREA